MGHIYAFMTGTRLDSAGDQHGDQQDSHSWADPTQGRTSLWESRNGVCPVACWAESVVAPYYNSYNEMVRDYVLSALSELQRRFDDLGDGTYVATEPESFPCTDELFVRKAHGPDGWTETPWHPGRDGGVRL